MYFMMVHWKQGNLEDKISQQQQIWLGVIIIMILYSEVCFLFCFAFVYLFLEWEKIRKEHFLLKYCVRQIQE